MSESMREYVARKLREDGFDGLAGEDCGCGVDDLMPCCEPWSDCTPAFKWECSAPCDIHDRDEDGAPNRLRHVCEGEPDGCYRTKKQEASS